MALSACGGQKHDTVPAADVIAAATTTQKTTSERMHQDVGMKVQGQSFHITADGAYDNRTHSGRTTAYFHIPTYSKLFKTDKPWVKFDLQALGEQQGFDINSLIGTGSSDPSKALNQLRAATGQVEVIGNEKVRGVTTNHYRATIDLLKTADLLPASQRAAASQSIQKIVALGASRKNTTDIWVSPADKRVHKLETKYSLKIKGNKFDVDQTIELFGFGAKVPPVEPPPADQTFDVAAAVSQAQGRTAP